MNTKTAKRRSSGSSARNKKRSFSGSFSRPKSGKFKSGRPTNKKRTRGGNGKHNNRKRNNRVRSGGGGRRQPTFDPSQFINKNPAPIREEVYVPKNKFEDFGLNQKLLKTILHVGIKAPSPIQDQVIPPIMEGSDVVGLAETGTGKTAAFLIPLIERTLKNSREKTLVLAPTRELAIQIEEELRKLTSGFKIFSVTCVGGVNIGPQIRTLKKTNHFIIGTPGRIMDLMDRKDLNTKDVTNVVLDEADRMLDMGFIGDMRKILSATPKNRNTLFFSATMTKEADSLVGEFLRHPKRVSVKKRDVTGSIEQDVVPFIHSNKFETLTKMLRSVEFKRVLIFGSMKHSVKRLAKELTILGFNSDSFHGNKSHAQRQQALKRFKSGQVRVLVATDVAARGIHVENVTHVINYDLPTSFEDYVHRIGRTGRAANRGKALTFVERRVKHFNKTF